MSACLTSRCRCRCRVVECGLISWNSTTPTPTPTFSRGSSRRCRRGSPCRCRRRGMRHGHPRRLPREEIACVGREDCSRFGESVSVSVSAPWNASYSVAKKSQASLSADLTVQQWIFGFSFAKCLFLHILFF